MLISPAKYCQYQAFDADIICIPSRATVSFPTLDPSVSYSALAHLAKNIPLLRWKISAQEKLLRCGIL
jgi:hypothetical protein